MKTERKIAFALGGLAGNNAHGAGFLEAALTSRVEPLMISCTSGQILWVYRYLRRLRGDGADLKAELENDIKDVHLFQNLDLDLATLALWGKHGIYRQAGMEYFGDAWCNVAESFRHLALDGNGKQFVLRRLLEMVPCRLLVPEFPNTFFENISRTFREEERIGIVFNSYNPAEGHEYVYLNDAARNLLRSTSRHPHHYKRGQPSSYRSRTIFQDISPQAVHDGLWLYQYGFNGDAGAHLDGAYFREIILSELTPARKIYVVRPMHYHWSGDLPRNWPQMEDLKTKVWFNGAYAGERSRIRLMNKLLESGDLKETGNHRNKYHHIDLEEIEMECNRGFFGYVFEDMAVFEESFRKSMECLADVGELATA